MPTLPVSFCTSSEPSPDVDWNAPASIAALARTAYPVEIDSTQAPSVVTLIRRLEVRWFEIAPDHPCTGAHSWRDTGESNGGAVRWTAYHTAEGRLAALAQCETQKMERSLFSSRKRALRAQASSSTQSSPREERALAWGPLSPEQVREWHARLPGKSRDLLQAIAGDGAAELFLNGVFRCALITSRLQRWSGLHGMLAAIAIHYTAPVCRPEHAPVLAQQLGCLLLGAPHSSDTPGTPAREPRS